MNANEYCKFQPLTRQETVIM